MLTAGLTSILGRIPQSLVSEVLNISKDRGTLIGGKYLNDDRWNWMLPATIAPQESGRLEKCAHQPKVVLLVLLWDCLAL